jgi:hypothetical protein
MNSIKILSKLCKLETLDAVERNILLLLYDKHLVQGEVNYLTPKELLELKLCKKSSLHSKLSNLSSNGFVDSIDGKYFITDKFLYELGKIEWEDLTIRQIDRVVANVKDHTIEKIEEFIKNELLTTSNQRQELFDLLRKSSNMMASLKSWFISEFGLSIGITHYNNFVKYNLA